MLSRLCHRTRSRHIATAWGAVHRCFPGGRYQALGRRPGADEPWSPDIVTAYGATPTAAYRELERKTGRPWRLAMLVSDFEELSRRERALLRSVVPTLRLVSPFVHAWGASIWEGHTSNPDRALGAWLAFTAAQQDELVVQELS